MKPEKVVFQDPELQTAYDELKEEDPIKKGLKKAIRDLRNDAFCGRNVKKSLIPEKYNS